MRLADVSHIAALWVRSKRLLSVFSSTWQTKYFCLHWRALIVTATASISVVILKISDLNENVYSMKEFLYAPRLLNFFLIEWNLNFL